MVNLPMVFRSKKETNKTNKNAVPVADLFTNKSKRSIAPHERRPPAVEGLLGLEAYDRFVARPSSQFGKGHTLELGRQVVR